MSYDKSNVPETWMFPLLDMGTGTVTNYAIKGPKGKNGLLIDYGVAATAEAFTALTTVPSVSVGSASDPDAYGDEFSLNGVAINSFSSVMSDNDVRATGYSTMMDDRTIPKDTIVYLVANAGTGSPTGQGQPFVRILWDD